MSLVPAQRARLAELEQVIDGGMDVFVAVGTALAEVRDGRLYRASHHSFEAYCRDRWNMSRQRAYDIMGNASVAQELSEKSDTPLNEAHVRQLASVPEGERLDVLDAVLAKTDGEPTAKAIQEERKARYPKPVAEAEAEDAPEAAVTPLPAPKPTPVPKVKDWPEVKEAERLWRPMQLMTKALRDVASNEDLLRGLDPDEAESVDLLADDVIRWANDWKKDRKAASGLRLVEDNR